MSSNPSQVELIGFEDDFGLRELLWKIGLFEDYRDMLPGHLAGILAKQHPAIVIDSIELLGVAGCAAGGMQEAGSLLRLRTFEVPIDLRVTLHTEAARVALLVQLVIKAESMDAGEPVITSDLYIKGQEPIGCSDSRLTPRCSGPDNASAVSRDARPWRVDGSLISAVRRTPVQDNPLASIPCESVKRTDHIMRMIALLTLTLLGGAPGFFAGGYSYNLTHPNRLTSGGSQAVSPYGDLRSAHLGVASALERHRGRHNWLIGGAILGAGVGFVGTLLAVRCGHTDGHRKRPGSDMTG